MVTVIKFNHCLDLNQNCESLIASLSAFGGVAAFVKEKFRGGTSIFVKVEICYILSHFAIPHRLKVGFASTH